MCCLRHEGGGEKKNTADQSFDSGPRFTERSPITHPFTCHSLHVHSGAATYLFLRHPPSISTPTDTAGVSAHIAMSLTSRVLGLFSTTATSDSNPSHAPELTGSAVNQPELGFDGQIMSSGAASHAHDDLIEEEPRPPYLHVRLTFNGRHCAMG